MAVAPLAYFFVEDFPDNAKFLRPHEARIVRHELVQDSGSSTTEHLSWVLFKQHSRDWFTWVSTGIFMCVVVPTYGFGFFVPSILVVSLVPSLRPKALVNNFGTRAWGIVE
jgi:hypothetical protein